jgi:SAM-dependent methyltransferase
MDLRAKELVRDGYDRIGSAYLEARPRDGADVELLELLLEALPARRRVLDAGCGAGLPACERLVSAGHQVAGLDFSFGQLLLARSHIADCELVLGDLASMPFAEASFDAVVSYYAIIHVPRTEHRRVFDEIRRVLRPDGLALLCLGWSDNPEEHDPSWLGVPMYWSHFDAQSNLGLLTDAGFEIRWTRRVSDPLDHASHQFVLAATP